MKLLKYAGMTVERMLLLNDWQTDQPQVFILGLPRSGTTLVYQYLAHRLDVAYFTHGDGIYHAFPLTAALLAGRGGYESDFASDYGKSTGRAAPHEAGGFWNRSLGAEDYIESVSPAIQRRLYRTVAGLQVLSGGKPFVNKNVKHLLRLPVLSRIFPHAHFLVVERSLHDTALSILRGRWQNLGDSARWWSVRPPDYAQIKDLPPTEQVARQVLSLRRRLRADLTQIEPGRVLAVDYAVFCQQPEQLISDLLPRLPGVRLKNSPVQAFPASHNTPRTDEEKALLAILEAAHETP